MSERNRYRKEIIEIQENGENEIKKLNQEIKILEKDNKRINNNVELKELKKTEEYTPPESIDTVLDYIEELAQSLDVNTNNDIFKDKTPTNYVSLCHLLLNKM